ncbi:DUF4158 domain-containing protein [Bacillus pseudomycoides]|uniref:DUF4158 domain-containing protein n=1 Tax=Bacillus TaxID=1386 RepID=UPI0022496E98|nr:DUF4158 domain-containing protein [Bacillus sp. DHT2]MDR4918642.1 DUF4158 domain-containing protein [Bacillus pseudomycoides]
MSSKRARELLTLDQRLEFVSISEQISEYELGSYYTLSPYDIEIIKRHRRGTAEIRVILSHRLTFISKRNLLNL